ncbi:NAD-dependent epimerase/dehydratase family protein [Spirochaetota bacterium]
MKDQKRALVCGAGGFIGHHLTAFLKKQGYWVRGVDIKYPEYEKTSSDEFKILDLRVEANCDEALSLDDGFDEVYQLAADMGGMGFIHSAESELMFNNTMINTNMANSAIRKREVPKYLFSSSACVYKNQNTGEVELTEEEAYPAFPDNEYGWEKLYAERMAMTFANHYPTQVCIARFQNCYGPLGTWKGGREKAPAALCRKVAEVEDDSIIDVWGDGTAIRAYTYIDDLVDGIYRLINSDLKDGINIGRQEYVTVDELAETIASVAGKTIKIKHIEGPVGVQARYFNNNKIESTGWKSKVSLIEGLKKTYTWIEGQVKNANKS